MTKDARGRKLGASICVMGLFLALGPGSAGAATITPNILTDEDANNGNCSLREAVTAANTDGDHNGCNPGGPDDLADVIVLGAGNTYQLTIAGVEDLNASGDLDIRDEDLTIQSSGATLATIDANGDGVGDPATTGDRAIHTAPNNVSTAVALTSLAVTDGLGGTGGGVRANAFTGGPAITGSTFFANTATTIAGGLSLEGVNATITNSTIDNNTAPVVGGIFSSFGLTMNRSTISDNTATAGGPGGIQFNNPITRTLTNTTVSGNSATTDGGGVFISGATLNLANSTIAGNTADSDNAGGGDGGGVQNAGGTLNVRNSIIADNVDVSGGAPDCLGAIVSQGFNLVEDLAGCSGTVGTDLTGQTPLLGALGPNGGPTETMALLAGSPAIDAGNPALPGSGAPACESIDQTNSSRLGTIEPCDIGAYELQQQAPVLPAIGDKIVQAGQTLGFSTAAFDINPGDVLIYSAFPLPAGASLDSATGAFSWTPTAAQAGTYPGVQFSVGDGTTSDSETVTLTVTAPPATPGATPPATSPATPPATPAKKKCKKKKGPAASAKKCKKKKK